MIENQNTIACPIRELVEEKGLSGCNNTCSNCPHIDDDELFPKKELPQLVTKKPVQYSTLSELLGVQPTTLFSATATIHVEKFDFES